MITRALHTAPARTILFAKFDERAYQMHSRAPACIHQSICWQDRQVEDCLEFSLAKLSHSRKSVVVCRRDAVRSTQKARRMSVQTNSGRSVHFESEDTYVIMEPGEEECFLSEEELRIKLRGLIDHESTGDLPPDLANFNTVDEAISYLINSVCELELGGGKGTVQWFQVRLES